MLEAALSKCYLRAYGLLRVASGLMLLFHGSRKIFGVLEGHMPDVGSQLWLAGLIELTAGAGLVLGLFTRGAALLASGTMAVAYVQFHWRFDFGVNFFPTKNQGELALLYCLVFLLMACGGAGRWSVDGWLRLRSARSALLRSEAGLPVRS